jgi:6-phosphogluconolactonase
MLHIQHIADPASALGAAADALAGALADALAARPLASLVVSGGDTARRLLPVLAACDLDWSRVVCTLADDRWVAADSVHSNEGLARALLPPATRLVALKTSHATAADALTAVTQRLAAVPQPFDATFLGMGGDGHIASLFPGGPELAASTAVVASTAPFSPPERISLSLRTLLSSRLIVLLTLGSAKARVLDRALAGDSSLPVSRLLMQDGATVKAIVGDPSAT